MGFGRIGSEVFGSSWERQAAKSLLVLAEGACSSSGILTAELIWAEEV